MARPCTVEMPSSTETTADDEIPTPGETSHRAEYRLLLECARWAAHGEAPAREAPDVGVPDGVDWESFARLAWGHSMAAPAYRWLADRPELDVPERVETALEARAERATYETLEMVRTLHRVLVNRSGPDPLTTLVRLPRCGRRRPV